MSTFRFLVEGLRDIRTVGTISRSSRFVSQTMVKHIDFTKTKCLVELGAGDGPITKFILKKMAPDAKLLAFEVNERMLDGLRKKLGNDPRLVIINDSAEHIGKYLAEHGFDKADHIISALPFVALPEELGDKIINESKKYLRDGGKFVQLNYSLIPRKRYEKVFGKSVVDFVALNIPPAFVIVCGGVGG